VSRGNGHAREVARYLAEIGAGSAVAEDLVVALTRRAAGETLEVDGLLLDPPLLEFVPEAIAFENRILPIHRTRKILFVAVPSGRIPEDALRELERLLGLGVEAIPVSEIDVGGVLVKAQQLLRRRGRGPAAASGEAARPSPGGTVALADLGLPSAILQRLKRAMRDPQGLLLVTGPAGAGKSTTLAALAEDFRRQALRVSTLDALQGLAALDEILLGDPDVLAIDGLLSPSVAARAVRAAVEGRRILIGVDAADGVGAVAKLTDMKVDPHLVALVLRGALNQRLLRRICGACRGEYREEAATLEDLRLESLLKDVPLRRGRGCDACGRSGYRGQVGVFEYGDRAADGSPREGFQPLVADALAKLLAGETTLKEVVDHVPFTQILQAADRLGVHRVDTKRFSKKT
jgi:type II secretory ATPase GspE/PulE/Tfp pilus assembly ATPase PilB-like protein